MWHILVHWIWTFLPHPRRKTKSKLCTLKLPRKFLFIFFCLLTKKKKKQSLLVKFVLPSHQRERAGNGSPLKAVALALPPWQQHPISKPREKQQRWRCGRERCEAPPITPRSPPATPPCASTPRCRPWSQQQESHLLPWVSTRTYSRWVLLSRK